ncbi:hypothetical protein [Phaffia rhodozyma]|uniref:Uncharacterized protein n=1 Tax=Phaffia rhodozyma TaxID=264483 RepID=A0A0F7SKL3_PHARH|nr:hypothetical protein [Phaffia rhodozyma]
MSSSKAMFSSALVALLAVSPLVQAHIQLASPYPINSALNPNTPEAEKDYSMTSPLISDGPYPCKGFIGQGYDQGTIPTYTAGKSMAITLAGTAVHGGGSCQLSLSYDNGTNFRVIESRIGGCPSDSLTFDVNLPSAAPAGKNVLFSWSWSNKLGNREFYQNCAIINIDSAATAPLTGPTIHVSNADVNSCTTIEGTPVVYPYPGDFVTYGGEYAGLSIGNGLTSGAGISDTDCFAPGSDGAGTSSGGASSTTVASTSSVAIATSTPAASSTAVAQASSTTTSAAVTASIEPSSVQAVASSTVSAISETSAPTSSSAVADVASSSVVSSVPAEASSTSAVESSATPTSNVGAFVYSSSDVSSPTSTVVSSSPSSSVIASTSAPASSYAPPTSTSASAAASTAETACTSGEWRCQGSVLQTCSWGAFVSMKDCSTQAGTVCNPVDPVGCVWPDQVVAATAATTAAVTTTSNVLTTSVSSTTATSAVTVNNAVVTNTNAAQPTTTSVKSVVSTPATSSATTSTYPASNAATTSTTCAAGSWACNGSVLQQCVNGRLMNLTDCALQAGTVCNSATPVGCVWPWQATSARKRDAVGRVPRGHGGDRRVVHGKRRARTH